ncbi:MAG TPA: lanthionine synthetase LanC family protein, partial [Kofleriaceae bacterium]|nr:lanthionine synthetase LanC family protein [Kofleriaceae bacterium]
MSAWEPLIADADPALARRAQEIVDSTAAFFRSCAGDTDGSHPRARLPAHATSPGLRPFLDRLTGSEGVPAVPLFCAYLALERGGARSLDATWTWLDRAVEVTSSRDELGPWLFTGAAGCAWVIAHVLRHASGARSLVDDRSTEDVDAMLAEFLAAHRGSIEPDIATGLSGIGAYYLEALPRESSTTGLESVLGLLRDRAEHRPR